MSDLKNCPLCGEGPVIKHFARQWVIECRCCGAKTDDYKYYIDATSAWNNKEVHNDKIHGCAGSDGPSGF